MASLRAATVRPEVILDETPAPQRLAPFAVALSAEVRHGNDDLATGRLVVLYDPQGQEAWEGPTRVVAYVRAMCEPEMAADPLLPGVGWSWLVEALDAHGAAFTAASGTVTRVASESFGGMTGTPASAEVEIRASWSPLDDNLGLHLVNLVIGRAFIGLAHVAVAIRRTAEHTDLALLGAVAFATT